MLIGTNDDCNVLIIEGGASAPDDMMGAKRPSSSLPSSHDDVSTKYEHVEACRDQ